MFSLSTKINLKDFEDKNNLTSGVKLILDNDDFNFNTGLTMYENSKEK